MKLAVIDNYDSFTYNLVQYLGELGATSDVVRNDAISVDEVGRRGADAIGDDHRAERDRHVEVAAEAHVAGASRIDPPLIGFEVGDHLHGPDLRRARYGARRKRRAQRVERRLALTQLTADRR